MKWSGMLNEAFVLWLFAFSVLLSAASAMLAAIGRPQWKLVAVAWWVFWVAFVIALGSGVGLALYWGFLE